MRLVAATNRNLDEEVKAGRFREDLWYRLNVFPITMPPLRERREDIPQLVQHFVEKHCRKLGRPLLQVSQGTLRDLQAHDWPGNVRELEAVVERAVITSTGPALRIGDAYGRATARGGTEAPPDPGPPTAAGRLEDARPTSSATTSSRPSSRPTGGSRAKPEPPRASASTPAPCAPACASTASDRPAPSEA